MTLDLSMYQQHVPYTVADPIGSMQGGMTLRAMKQKMAADAAAQAEHARMAPMREQLMQAQIGEVNARAGKETAQGADFEAKRQADAAKKMNEEIAAAAQWVQSNADPAGASKMVIGQFMRDPHKAKVTPLIFGGDPANFTPETAQFDPQLWDMLATGQTSAKDQIDLNIKKGTLAATEQRHKDQAFDEKEQRRIQAGQLSVAQGHLKLAQDKLAFDKSKKPDMTPSEAAREAKHQDAYLKDASALDNVHASLDEFKGDVGKLLTHPGLNQITGRVGGRFKGALGGEGAAAQALLDKILGQSLVTTIQTIKASGNGSTGFGPLSDSEGAAIKAAFAALKQTQDLPAFKAALEALSKKLNNSKELFTRAFKRTHAAYESRADNPTTEAPTTKQGRDAQGNIHNFTLVNGAWVED